MEREQGSFQGGSGPRKSLEHSRHYQNPRSKGLEHGAPGAGS